MATISYVATGDASAGKERLEVLGDGAEAILEDFRRLELRRGGKVRVVRKAAQDKGHEAGVAAFLTAVRDGGAPPIPVATIAAVTRATFAALDSLATGERGDVPPGEPAGRYIRTVSSLTPGRCGPGAPRGRMRAYRVAPGVLGSSWAPEHARPPAWSLHRLRADSSCARPRLPAAGARAWSSITESHGPGTTGAPRG